MATRYIGVALGGALKDVTDSGSTTSAAIELVIDMTAVPKRQDVVLALEQIESYLLQRVYPLT